MLRFSYVLPAVLAHTSSIPLDTIRIDHKTYRGYLTHHDKEHCVHERHPFLERFLDAKHLKNDHMKARETLDTTKATVYGGVDRSWEVSWAPVAAEHG